jgi:hypothetical protein
MSLKQEIAALREEIERRSRAKTEAPPASATGENGERHRGVDAILASAASAIEEVGGEVDKFPRLGAIAAFGVGLALGVILGRQVR